MGGRFVSVSHLVRYQALYLCCLLNHLQEFSRRKCWVSCFCFSLFLPIKAFLLYVQVCVCVCICRCVFMCTCVDVCMCMRLQQYVYVCVCICRCEFMPMCVYTYGGLRSTLGVISQQPFITFFQTGSLIELSLLLRLEMASMHHYLWLLVWVLGD